jgi:hypothetical protein
VKVLEVKPEKNPNSRIDVVQLSDHELVLTAMDIKYELRVRLGRLLDREPLERAKEKLKDIEDRISTLRDYLKTIMSR